MLLLTFFGALAHRRQLGAHAHQALAGALLPLRQPPGRRRRRLLLLLLLRWVGEKALHLLVLLLLLAGQSELAERRRGALAELVGRRHHSFGRADLAPGQTGRVDRLLARLAQR